MSEVIVWKLLDIGFTLLQMGLARDAIVAKVKEQEEAGATPEQVIATLVQMRKEAAAAAAKAIADKLALQQRQ